MKITWPNFVSSYIVKTERCDCLKCARCVWIKLRICVVWTQNLCDCLKGARCGWIKLRICNVWTQNLKVAFEAIHTTKSNAIFKGSDDLILFELNWFDFPILVCFKRTHRDLREKSGFKIKLELTWFENYLINYLYLNLYLYVFVLQTSFDLTWFDLTWFHLTRFDLTWFHLTWFDFISFDMIWFHLTWLGLSSPYEYALRERIGI